MRAGRAVAAGLALCLLAACEGGPPELMNLRADGEGPDEFAILPPKALQLPTDLAALPQPTPGGGNLTDPNPRADAIAALGGNPAGGAGGDAALLSYTGRYGRAPDIRATLAAEDFAFRDQNRGRVLERLFNTTVYYQAYKPLSLDQQAELRRWRARGVATPSAPPPRDGE